MQSRPQTRGSILRKGIRQDAVVREIPSATAVLFRDEFGMTLPLRYNYLVALFISPGAFPIARSDQPLRMKARSNPVDGIFCLDRTKQISLCVGCRCGRSQERARSLLLKYPPRSNRPTRLELTMTIALEKPAYTQII
jgi:hypothetical protein